MPDLHLDVITLLAAVIVASSFSTAARLVLWRLHPGIPGLAEWAFAGAAATTAFLVLFACRGHTLTPLWLSIASFSASLGILSAWQGFRRFNGTPAFKLHHWLPLLALTVGPMPLLAADGSMAGASGWYNAVIAAISAAIAWELFVRTGPERRITRLTAWVYTLNGVFFGFRSLLVLADPSVIPPTIERFSPATLLWWLCVTLAATLCMALMTGEKLQADLNDQARRDPLTGALNRRAFTLEADRELARARRNGRPVSVLMMDLDHFKTINDSMGHAIGDQALCLFADIAQQSLRMQDLFCRFGGEEFTALLPDCDVDAAVIAAERLRTTYAEAAQAAHPHSPRPFTVSIGIAQGDARENMDVMLQRADRAMYAAKQAGRNRSMAAEPPPSAQLPMRA